MVSFYSESELKQLGLKIYGTNVLISRKASIYGASQITIGSNVRIDDFCILSGKITIENFIHIAAYSCLFGGHEGIEIKDYANISSRNAIYAINDDYSGMAMTNPMIPDKYKKVEEDKVIIGRHVIIGSGCTILPGVNLAEGSAFGSMSLINRSSEPWSINVGIPAKKIKDRSMNLLKIEKKFEQELN